MNSPKTLLLLVNSSKCIFACFGAERASLGTETGKTHVPQVIKHIQKRERKRRGWEREIGRKSLKKQQIPHFLGGLKRNRIFAYFFGYSNHSLNKLFKLRSPTYPSSATIYHCVLWEVSRSFAWWRRKGGGENVLPNPRSHGMKTSLPHSRGRTRFQALANGAMLLKPNLILELCSSNLSWQGPGGPTGLGKRSYA